MKNSVSLALVSSKFQLKNAYEICQQRKNKLIIFAFYLNEIHSNQVKQFANNNGIDILFELKMRRITQYFDLFFKILLINFKFNIVNLLVGHSNNNLIKICIKFLNFSNLLFVDDGEILELINKEFPKFYKNYIPLNYYTIFKVKSNKYLKINKLSYTKINIRKINDLPLFIGTCYVENGFLEEDVYLILLKKIIEKEGKLAYYPHPRENQFKLKNIPKLEIISPNEGIDEYIITRKFLPKKIIGLYSSTYELLLNSINSIYEKLFFIDIRKLSYHEKINDFEYNYLKANFQEYKI